LLNYVSPPVQDNATLICQRLSHEDANRQKTKTAEKYKHSARS